MTTVSKLSPEVDAYLARVEPFAQPILKHLRALVHQGCPGVEEVIKWSRPFFVYRGAILCNMSGFKQHCSFGFWGEEIASVLRDAQVLGKEGMGSLGRITALGDLPSDKKMLGWIRQAKEFIDTGEHTSPIAARRSVVKPTRVPLTLPAELTAAFDENQQAAARFAQMSPSSRREYVEWIAGAKRPETKQRRLQAAIALIAESKQLHSKYQG